MTMARKDTRILSGIPHQVYIINIVIPVYKKITDMI